MAKRGRPPKLKVSGGQPQYRIAKGANHWGPGDRGAVVEGVKPGNFVQFKAGDLYQPTQEELERFEHKFEPIHSGLLQSAIQSTGAAIKRSVRPTAPAEDLSGAPELSSLQDDDGAGDET